MTREPSRRVAERFARGKGVVALWVGFLGGPAVWFFHLVVSYSLVRYVCFTGAMWLMHLTTAVSLLAVGAVIGLAWRNWQQAGRPMDAGGEGMEGRSRFMALIGLLFAVSSLLLVVVQGAPNFVLDPCI